MRAHRKEKGWDGVGIALSVACGVHCLVFPFLPSFLLVSEGCHGHGCGEGTSFHQLMAALVCVVAVLSFWRCCRDRKDYSILAMASAGIVLLVLPLLVAALHQYETLLTVAGVLLLGSAHVRNLYKGTCTCTAPGEES